MNPTESDRMKSIGDSTTGGQRPPFLQPSCGLAVFDARKRLFADFQRLLEHVRVILSPILSKSRYRKRFCRQERTCKAKPNVGRVQDWKTWSFPGNTNISIHPRVGCENMFLRNEPKCGTTRVCCNILKPRGLFENDMAGIDRARSQTKPNATVQPEDRSCPNRLFDQHPVRGDGGAPEARQVTVHRCVFRQRSCSRHLEAGHGQADAVEAAAGSDEERFPIGVAEGAVGWLVGRGERAERFAGAVEDHHTGSKFQGRKLV